MAFEGKKYNPVTREVVEGLVAAVGGDESRVKYWKNDSDAEEIQKHSNDHGPHKPQEPEAVVFPLCTEEVQAIVRLAAAHNVALTTASSRTGLEGGAIPVQRGIVCDMLKMNKVLEVYHEDLQATVQAGAMKTDMAKFAEENGWFFAVDPGSEASIGGYASTGASGTLSVKYGTMRDNVVRLRVVLSDGRVMWTRSRAIKSSTGYDLTRLFMGAEGTLGIVTELTIKFHPTPVAIVAAVAPFPSIVESGRAVISIAKAKPTSLARCELLNAQAIDCVNALFKSTHQSKPTLFLEFHSSHIDAAMSDAALLEEVCRQNGAVEYQLTSDEKERDSLWQARRGAYFAAYKARSGPGIKLCVTDVCVPVSKFADIVTKTEEDFSKNSETGLPCPIVGHACDGNFHVLCPFDTTSEAEVADLKALDDRMVLRAIGAGGTASGEHGIGLGKQKYLESEHGPVAVEVMRELKAVMDPQGIFNPSKILPPRSEAPKLGQELASAVFDEAGAAHGCGC